MMILAVIEVIELANSPQQQQHCLDTDDSDEYERVTSRGHYDCVDIKLNTSILKPLTG